ncbi:hypothetical protein [Thioalkalivibrio sp. XN279]|uniref:hypothetical protein n=1 Tax=Thioalkalivibrio sp. XN279 TaxID=2714953 RepID=UPI00140CA092|nr:hypothetical protein [Thioalkalivibrio sp. XN279]NHA14489.1 hypothetical protein [Thioalkalivibrio sp. XN279]
MKRFPVFRDVVVFQAKLLVDGLRDLLISPVSVLAALVDLLVPGNDGGKRFYAVVRFGRRTEEWINLFGAADTLDARQDPSGLDVVIADLEEMLRDPARRDEARLKAQALVDRLKGGGKDEPNW